MRLKKKKSSLIFWRGKIRSERIERSRSRKEREEGEGGGGGRGSDFERDRCRASKDARTIACNRARRGTRPAVCFVFGHEIHVTPPVLVAARAVAPYQRRRLDEPLHSRTIRPIVGGVRREAWCFYGAETFDIDKCVRVLAKCGGTRP